MDASSESIRIMEVTTDAESLGVTTMSAEDDEGDDGAIYFEILLFLATYIYPLVVFGGVLSNVVGFAVMLKRKMRSQSVCVYLSLLAISDSLVLILDFINNWVKEVMGGYLIGVNTPLCVLYRYSFEVFFTYSAWLVVAITAERLVVVIAPLKAKSLVTVSRARIICAAIFGAVCVYKLYNLPVWVVTDEGLCDWRTGWESFHENVNMLLNFSMYSYIPSLILIVCNVLIVVQIWRQSKRRAEMSDSVDNSEIRRITIMVLMISLTYIVLTVPLSAYYTIQYADAQFIDMTPQMAMGEIIILLIGLSNHGVNLYLYVLVSRNFRAELYAMLCCKMKSETYKKSPLPKGVQDAKNSSNNLASDSGSFDSSQTKPTAATSVVSITVQSS